MNEKSSRRPEMSSPFTKSRWAFSSVDFREIRFGLQPGSLLLLQYRGIRVCCFLKKSLLREQWVLIGPSMTSENATWSWWWLLCAWLVFSIGVSLCLTLLGLPEKYHRLGDLTNRHLFLTVLKAGSPKSVYQHIWFLVKILSWIADSYLLVILSYDRGRKRVLVSSLF